MLAFSWWVVTQGGSQVSFKRTPAKMNLSFEVFCIFSVPLCDFNTPASHCREAVQQ